MGKVAQVYNTFWSARQASTTR